MFVCVSELRKLCVCVCLIVSWLKDGIPQLALKSLSNMPISAAAVNNCLWSCKQETHIVPEGVSSDRILRSQRNAAENDEKQDEISEDVVMDQGMAAHSYPGRRHKENCCKLCVVYMVQNSKLLYLI